MTNSNAKGKRGEREFAKFLRDKGYNARRGQQYAGGGDSPDVITDLDPLHFEVKRVEAFQLYKALAQARFDADFMRLPVVAYRRNKENWVAVLDMHDFIKIYQVLDQNDLLGEIIT